MITSVCPGKAQVLPPEGGVPTLGHMAPYYFIEDLGKRAAPLAESRPDAKRNTRVSQGSVDDIVILFRVASVKQHIVPGRVSPRHLTVTGAAGWRQRQLSAIITRLPGR